MENEQITLYPTEDDLYNAFNQVDPPLNPNKLPTIYQIQTAYRKNKKYVACRTRMYVKIKNSVGQTVECACPLAVVALGRGIPGLQLNEDCTERVAGYWSAQIGYWNASWLFHGIDEEEAIDMEVWQSLTVDQQISYRRGQEIRQYIEQTVECVI